MIEWIKDAVPAWVLYAAAVACLLCMCASILFGRTKDDGWKRP